MSWPEKSCGRSAARVSWREYSYRLALTVTVVTELPFLTDTT